MTSVAARAPAASGGGATPSSFRATIEATACGKISPVDLCRLLSTPTPSGLVRLIGRPGARGVVAQQPLRVGDAR